MCCKNESQVNLKLEISMNCLGSGVWGTLQVKQHEPASHMMVYKTENSEAHSQRDGGEPVAQKVRMIYIHEFEPGIM